jgi:argininosuccinate lyase
MMPHKKNPDLLELIRGKSGRMIGDLVAMLTVLKGLPLAYNSDLQEDKERTFDALDTLKPALRLLAMLWPRLRFDAAAMRAAAGGFALATDLAEYLVRHGVAFRRAHEIVGALVREASAAGRALEGFTLADLRRYSSAFGRDALRALTAEGSVRARNLTGGPAAAAMRRYLRRLETR